MDREKRTVDVVWTTGATVRRASWFDGPFNEVLSLDPAHVRMARLQSGRAPFLLDHAASVSATVGVVESAQLEKGGGTATIRFAAAGIDPEADRTFEKIADGIIRNVSVGYRTWKVQKSETPGETIPTLRAVDWEPHEISAVAIGADPEAGTRAAAELNDCEVINPNPRGTMNTETSPQDNPTTDPAVLAERERVVAIRASVRAARLGDAFADRLIADGTAADRARAQVLDELAQRSNAIETHTHVSMGETAGEKFVRGATASLVTRAAGPLVREALKREVEGLSREDLEPGEFRGMTLLDLARLSLERQGVKTRGMDKLTLVGRAFTTRGAYSGTSDFPTMLENAMHKVLRAAYGTTADTWSRIAKTELVADFRPHPRYRTGSFGVLDSIAENGEFKNKSIPDAEKLEINLATKGNIIGISRKAVINDDMGAFSDLALKLGRAARMSIESDFYALLAQNSGLGPTMSDSQPFFHSNRANVGTGSALGVPGLDADRAVMARQKDPSGNEYLDLRPSVLLVPLELGGAARVLNESQYDVTTTNKFQVPNMVRGLFREVVDSPRLSGTRRYLFADPLIAPAIVVAFLDGQGEAPIVESQEGWRIDGTELKVRLDYQVQVHDPRGAVTNAGV